MTIKTSNASDRPLVQVSQAVKTYGHTRALSGVELQVNAGEVLGLVGHNGAGKSTLMRLLSGLERLDNGTVDIGGMTTPGAFGFSGVRMAYQESSLAPELTVRDNIYLSSARWLPRWCWHKAAAESVVSRLGEIFPDHGIGPNEYVDDLPIADRQRVEIARATITDDLKLLILDEPTESLSGSAVDHLYNYVRKLKATGVAVILVSHRMREILSVSDRVAVMKDGAVVSIHRAGEVSERDLLLAMGGEVLVTEANATPFGPAIDGGRSVVVRVPMTTVSGEATEITAREGEVIGLAGIVGQGQEEVLDRIWHGKRGDIKVDATRAYVPGDRQRSGILPLWNVDRNLTISALSSLSRHGIRQFDAEELLVDKWVKKLNIRGGSRATITGLSGGNQQKVIAARAFASNARTILLDDPFRGVDVHTKAELYQLIREEAAKGRTIVWFSSENSEMQHCDRVYVLRAGRVAGVLHGTEITDNRIITMSFAESETNAA
ncbi:ATP-binding cassette domain-containing protein [Mesorhizobium retamae]|uniref:Sugar ABC transporter ATP-binding protein n=1 Tax=Mesorhizobium retamae TaxID=2912854 RepID=A0ABS9QD71_9HYPH|nr:sugar ABC transporter ATP-binding protein [Mesorhizobium sp. IRAMC:0171]MCG7505367.1 sugar ABC transporter ATP-binding protein [Mesorhizobium sp. IRAMC:0171]